MLQALSEQTPNHSSVDPYIKQWLEQRQAMLVLYSQLCHATKAEAEKLAVFCQTLVDYLSLGHFSVYEKLTTSEKTSVLSDQKDVLEKISTTTDQALDFNEKYSESFDLQSLSHDLSQLGEQLAHRMDLEDQLFKPYLKLFI